MLLQRAQSCGNALAQGFHLNFGMQPGSPFQTLVGLLQSPGSLIALASGLPSSPRSNRTPAKRQ
ncbi:hypothetical protein O5698_23280 [Escherichia coli]|nr:hypothetical protein [Escherichia coli]